MLLQAPDRAAAIGQAGRVHVQRAYTWPAHLAVLDRQLAALRPAAPGPAPARAMNQEPVA